MMEASSDNIYLPSNASLLRRKGPLLLENVATRYITLNFAHSAAVIVLQTSERTPAEVAAAGPTGTKPSVAVRNKARTH